MALMRGEFEVAAFRWLAEPALNGKLSRGDIKKAIKAGRPDYWRV
jgi:hypothetical protein